MDGAGITHRSLGLSGWEEAALTRPLACCCRADGLERSGWGWLAAGSQAEWRWKRRRDPWRGKSFCRGRVCFNAGLSWEAVLVHCYWQCWSLERCFALPIVPSRNPILPPVRSWARNSQLFSFHKETRRLSLPHRGAAGRSTPVRFWLEQCVPFRACVAPAPELSASVHPPGCAWLSGFHPQQLPSNIYLHCFVCSCALWGGSVFALRRRFLAVARAEAWQMGGDGRSGSMMNLFFLPCLKLPVKIQQPHLRSA